VRRLAARARYDQSTVYAILDEAVVCHLGTSADGEAIVLPTNYVRVGDALYLHGAPGNAALERAVAGGAVCIAVTIVDGLVLARSAFHHSLNYRSVVLFGTAVDVTDPVEKRLALLELVEHIVPGRGRDARPPNDGELRATRVIRIEIEEASAKVRTGGPVDDPDDLLLTEIWAGQVPLAMVRGTPVPDGPSAAAPDGPRAASPPLPEYLRTSPSAST
jgi:hypothetical protein